MADDKFWRGVPSFGQVSCTISVIRIYSDDDRNRRPEITPPGTVRLHNTRQMATSQLRPKIATFLWSATIVFGSFLVGNIIVLLAIQFLMISGVPVLERPGLRLGISTVLLQGVAFGGIGLLYHRTRDLEIRPIVARVPSLRETGWILGGAIVLFGTERVISFLISTIGIEVAQNQVVKVARDNPTVILLLMVFSILVVGPGEELLYRGVVQGRLRESFSSLPAIVLASGLFASIHLFSLQGGGKLVYVGVAFVLALILGTLYEYTGNLVVPSLVHGVYNAAQFGLVYYSVVVGA